MRTQINRARATRWVNILTTLVVLGIFWGCSRPTREQCETACTKTVRILAENIEGESNEKVDRAMKSAVSHMEPCVSTCMEQDEGYVTCLAEADSLKRIRECIAVR